MSRLQIPISSIHERDSGILNSLNTEGYYIIIQSYTTTHTYHLISG